MPWTPGCWTACSDDSEDEAKKESGQTAVHVYNRAMESLFALAGQSPSQLTFQLQTDWDVASQKEKDQCVERATEASKLICKIIAPTNPEKLFQSMAHGDRSLQNLAQSLHPLMTAYAQAPTKTLKTQILSIYAFEHTIAGLQKLHEPYAKVSQRQIKRARAHARLNGPGVNVTKEFRHRICLDMEKVDHFVDFVNRPYFHQDVAYGMRKLKLENGEALEMPNIIRTVTRSTMISQYVQFCKEEDVEPLSRATLYRILEVREASERKSLAGLDDTAADGTTAFQTLRSIAEQLVQVGVEKKWSQNIFKRLDQAKQYLKTDYKTHCLEDESLCADHCIPFALSDPDDANFQITCSHRHSVVCEKCEDLKAIFIELSEKISHHQDAAFSQDLREDLLYDCRASQNHIMKWKAHILRGINQEKAKQMIIANLDDSSVLLVMDWAMKFIQKRFREKQSEWFGKRGLSWHVSSVISKNSETKAVSVTSYVHLLNECNQEWFSVASLIEDLLRVVKSSWPAVDKAFLRSDEAGCYHNNCLIAAAREIGERAGIAIVRYDFSEPQQGKDICDRIICPLKSSVRKYCNEGHDVLSADDMFAALKKYPVKGATASVCEVDETRKNIEVKNIQNFSSFHNFEFTVDNIKVWKAYGIGGGRSMREDSVLLHQQQSTGLRVHKEFTETSSRRQKNLETTEGEIADGENQGIFDCLEENCNFSFSSFSDLQIHMDLGDHSRFVNNESVYDTLRREWVTKYSTITSDSHEAAATQHITEPLAGGECSLEMGWALSKARTGGTRFSKKVRQYLVAKFNYGQKTGKKCDPVQVAADMRQAKSQAGDRLFSRNEWLTATQVKGSFSRLTRHFKGQLATADVEETAISNDAGDEPDDDDEEETTEREDLMAGIKDQIQVLHPIFYDSFDLCEIYHSQQLSSFKVVMLREICAYFDIKVKSKDKKNDIIRRLSEMIESCGCKPH